MMQENRQVVQLLDHDLPPLVEFGDHRAESWVAPAGGELRGVDTTRR
jgi:hypothetical protein